MRDGSYAGTNFRTSTTLLVKNAVSGGGYVRQTYFTFNLQGVAPVTSAVLQLYGQETAGSPEPSINLAAYPVADTSWSQSQITFRGAPAAGTQAINTLTVKGAAAQTYTLDLTRYVQQQQAIGNELVSVVLAGTASTNGGIQFNGTLAAANQPALLVTAPATPAPVPVPTTPLAAPWSGGDVGSPGLAGASGVAPDGSILVTGGGPGIGAGTDAFQFAWQSLTGNGSIVARVASQSNGGPSAAGGIMIRESLAGDARFVTLLLSPGSGTLFQYRAVSHNAPVSTPSPEATGRG